MNLNRYDWGLLRQQVGPAVRESVRLAARQRDTEGFTGGSRVPVMPGTRQGGEREYVYTVRYREPAPGGIGRQDTLVEVRSRTALDAEEAERRAAEAINNDNPQDTLGNSLGLDPLYRPGTAILLSSFRTS